MDKQVAKLRRRLDSALGQRQFYEAHQIMRTIHWRIIQQYEQTAAAEPQKNPSAEAQVEDLLKMLRVGCITMCDAREFTSAIDLAELYVDALKRTQQQLSSDNFANLLQLFSLLPAELDSDNSAPLVDSDDAMSDGNECKKTTDRRTPFMNKSLDWALKSAEGRPERLQSCVELQRRFAEVLAGEGRIEQADRLVRAADWLLSQIDRGTQSSAGPSVSAEEGGMESTPVEQPQESRIVSDIDLD